MSRTSYSYIHYTVAVFFAYILYKVSIYEGLNTIKLIEQQGYLSETHYITTEDGYILTYYRIISTQKNKNSKGPVLLMHGLVESSASFVLYNKSESLAFILANEGYDVWLGNQRGNAYCQKHTHLNPVKNHDRFYNYSFHEVGYYDLPSAIDYILLKTKSKQIHYIGLTTGASAFLVLGSTRPEYNSKIKLASLIRPLGYLEGVTIFSIYGIVFKNIRMYQEIMEALNWHEVPFADTLRKFAPAVCKMSIISSFCQIGLSIATESFANGYKNKDYIPVILANTPSNTAMKMLYHIAQIIRNDGNFTMFDYGLNNKKIYGSNHPTQYNLRKISAPVAVYYSKHDREVRPENIQKMSGLIQDVKKQYMISSNNFKHSSFIYGHNVVEQVYKVLVKEISKY